VVPEPLQMPRRDKSTAVTGLPPAGHKKSVVREYAEAFVIAIALALVIRTFFIQAYKIPSGSMEPTLLIGDHILVNKMIYGLRVPDSLFGLTPLSGSIPYGQYIFRFEPVHRGDVVVFVFPPDPTKDFIKRVVGIGGDMVEVRGKSVYLNGRKMDEPHAFYQPSESQVTVAPRDRYGPATVPKGEVFVMGDNRDRSYDSRFWGFVPEGNVEGRAMIIYWSWDSDSSSFIPIRWNRFGRIIH
jgi:signal peptidase I